MRREGRIHGSNVRVNKKEVAVIDKAASKPTNHSKVSARCPGNVVRCVGCSHGLPVKKSIGKVKTALKARDLDVTKNHKMHEWSFSQKHRWGEFGGEGSGDQDDAHGGPCVESDDTEEYWTDDQPSRSPVMECPIELLMQMRKPKAVRRPVFTPEALALPTATTESVDSDDSEYESVIDDESWSDFDFSDGEEVSYAEEPSASDDWVFVTELE